MLARWARAERISTDAPVRLAGQRAGMSCKGLAWARLLATGLAFALRVQGLPYQSLWRDEVDSLRFATQPLGQLLQRFVAPGQNGPLYYLLLRPWLDAVGQTEFSLRFFSVIAGTLAVPLVYRLGRRMAPRSPSVRIAASLLAAVSPYLVWYSQEARMYAAVVCLVLGSMECLQAALERGGRLQWLGYVLLTAAALYFHFLTVLMVPVHLVMLLILRNRQRARAAWEYFAALGCVVALILPLLSWQLPRVLNPSDGGYAFVSLPRMLASMAVTYSSGVLPGVLPWSLAVLLVLSSAALARARGEMRGSVAALAAWLFLPVLGLFLLTLVQPLYTARYLIFVLPALLLLAGIGVQKISRRVWWLGGVLAAALMISSLVSVWRQAATPVKADMRSAASYVATHMDADDTVVFQIPYARHSFEYYFNRVTISHSTGSPGGFRLLFPLVTGPARSLLWMDGLYTNGGMAAAEVHLAMQRQVADSKGTWLVAAEAALWDERGLVQSWLEAHATVTTRAEFVGVIVSRYELP